MIQFVNDLTIPLSEFYYHAEKHILVPVDAYIILEWKNTLHPAEQIKEMVDTTKDDNNPLLLIFDFKQ